MGYGLIKKLNYNCFCDIHSYLPRGKGKPSFILVGDVLLHHNQSEVHTGLAAESRRIIAIKDFVIHPRYNSSSSKYNDIGIITLKEKVVFSRNVKPACLPQPEYRLENRNVPLTATGWGLTEFAGRLDNQLFKYMWQF